MCIIQTLHKPIESTMPPKKKKSFISKINCQKYVVQKFITQNLLPQNGTIYIEKTK